MLGATQRAGVGYIVLGMASSEKIILDFTIRVEYPAGMSSKASQAGALLATLSNVHVTEAQRKARSENLAKARAVRIEKLKSLKTSQR